MQQPQHTTAFMSDALKLFLAEKVYETIRGTLIMTAPDMKTWADLNDEERAQCMNSMWFWIAGLGSNEVGHAWYNRSGQIPRAIWGQLPGFEHETVFTMAGLDLLIRLIGLAERGVHVQRNEPVSQHDLWRKLNADAILSVGGCTLYRDQSDRAGIKGNYIITRGDETHSFSTIGDAAVALVTMLGTVKEKTS